MDRALETSRILRLHALGERGKTLLQMLECFPKQRFAHPAVADLVRMTQRITRRRRRSAQCAQGRHHHPQPITDIVQTQRVAQLRIQQCHHMTKRAERARLFIHPELPRQLRHQIRRNQIDQLAQNRTVRVAWLSLVFFTPCLLAG
jgi:hypothetical protein